MEEKSFLGVPSTKTLFKNNFWWNAATEERLVSISNVTLFIFGALFFYKGAKWALEELSFLTGMKEKYFKERTKKELKEAARMKLEEWEEEIRKEEKGESEQSGIEAFIDEVFALEEDAV